MLLTLERIQNTEEETLGALYLDGKLQCFTLEDEYRKVKLDGETRIPRGLYDIKLRTEGRLHEAYKLKYDFHKGMLWLQDVPGFTFIYFHIGNSNLDTSGCILVGAKASILGNGAIGLEHSTIAYKDLYRKVIENIDDLRINIL